MNSTETNINCNDLLFFRIIFVYGGKVTYYGTVLTTLLCTFTFTIIVYRSNSNNSEKSQMYKYFLVRSFFDFLVYVSTLPEVEYYNTKQHSYAWQIWFIWIYLYFFYIFVSVSNYLDVAATLDCYFLVKNKFLFFLKKKTFFIVLTVLMVINIVFNIHFLLIYDIIKNDTFKNSSTWILKRSDYGTRPFYLGLNTLISIYREVLPLILLLIINLFILLFIKETSARKRRIQTNSNRTATNIENAKMNKIKMIIAVSLSYLILRTPFLINEMSLHSKTIFWECYYYSVAIRLYDTSFGIQIFIYFSFNKKFRNCLVNTFKLNKIFNINSNN
jgi:hypothetical protein